MIPTVRHEIDDQWIEVYTEIKHPTSVEIKTVLKPYMVKIPLNISVVDYKKKLAEIITPADDSKTDDILILRQVKAWSFGEVTQKVLDEEVSEPKRQQILSILGELYFPLVGNGSETSLNITTAR